MKCPTPMIGPPKLLRAFCFFPFGQTSAEWCDVDGSNV
jgi:hypothetical protein